MLIKYACKGYSLLVEYATDFCLFVRHNCYSPLANPQRRLFYRIIIVAHTIEKGLALPNPRILFGRTKIDQLLELVDRYSDKNALLPVQMAAGALLKYTQFHKELGISDPFLIEIENSAHSILKRFNALREGGIRDVTGTFAKIEAKALSYGEFLRSRFSCRSFDTALVDHATILELVSSAQSAPSQCNRQSVRLHLIQDDKDIESLLRLQGGSNGFAHDVRNLIIITSDTNAWGGPGQRNQAYVDGGLFAMNFLLACHASGLVACPLNLAVENSLEKQIKVEARIPQAERLVMMIAFGNPKTGPLTAARSARIPVNEILTIRGNAEPGMVSL